jgi:hypothetical protein
MVTNDRPTGALQRKSPFAFNQVSASLFHCPVDMHILNNPACFPSQLLIANMISQIQMKENIHTFGISCIIVYNVSAKLTHFRMCVAPTMCGKRYCCPAAVLQLSLIPKERKL